MDNIIYLDNAATTKPYNFDLIKNNTKKDIWMNPSSLYSEDLKEVIDTSKKLFMGYFCPLEQKRLYDLIFTSGATESNNWVIHNTMLNNIGSIITPTIITSPFEHPSIINTLKYYEAKGLIHLEYLQVDDKGHVIADSLIECLCECDNPILVTCMWVNNEIGTIQPIKELSQICYEYAVPFHVDATQAVGKMDLFHKCDNISSISFSGHKFHGPKNIGGLLIQKDFLKWLNPFMLGGHQQNGNRAGTENAEIIQNLAYCFSKSKDDVILIGKRSKEIHELFYSELKKYFLDSDFIINSHDITIPIINVAFKNISGEYIAKELIKEKFYISTGSACSTGDLAVSDTITVLNLPQEYQNGVIRISFDSNTKNEEIILLVRKIYDIFSN